MSHGKKTKKALSKRIKITSTGKIFKRPPHQNHFNARDTGQETRRKRGFKEAPRELQDIAKALLSY